MGFDFPLAFLLLLAVPAALWILYRGIRRTGTIAAMFGSGLAANRYTQIKSALLVIFLVSLIAAAARPYIVPRSTADFVFMVDVSRSMMARNYCSEPTFLDRAGEVMHKLIVDIPEARYGLMVFARLAFPVTQVTYNHEYLHDAIDNGVRIGMIYEATATALPNALTEFAKKKREQRDSYGETEYLILLSDGHVGGDWRNEMAGTVQQLRQAGVKVIAVGIGNPGETPIPRITDGECVDDYLRVDGQILRIPLGDDLLKFIATETGGEYFGEGSIEELITFMRDNALTLDPQGREFSRQQQRDISTVFLTFATFALFGLLLL